jgi:hypothetical protein
VVPNPNVLFKHHSHLILSIGVASWLMKWYVSKKKKSKTHYFNKSAICSLERPNIMLYHVHRVTTLVWCMMQPIVDIS